jgi:hypothetical protein
MELTFSQMGTEFHLNRHKANKAMKKAVFVLFYFTAGFLSCKKPVITQPGAVEPGTLLYSGNCGSGSNFHWIDNESIIVNDHCEGTLKRISTINKSVQFIAINKDHLLQNIFFTEDIPGLFFYTALTKNGSGSFSMPLKLFSFNLSSSNVLLVQDNISESPQPGSPYFAIGRKKMAFRDGKRILVIDLEKNASEEIPISTSFRIGSFSPDDTKLLIDTLSVTGSTNTVLYDFGCNCNQPSTLITSNTTVLWRPPGVYGYRVSSSQTQAGTEFLNLSTGTALKIFDLITRPWINPKSTLVFVWVRSSSTAGKGLLMSFDLLTQQTKELFTSDCCLLSVNNEVTMATLSPDGKKLAFSKGGYLRLISM